MANLDGAALRAPAGEARFFRMLATTMAVVQVFGFAFQYLAGRSSFSAPLVVHLHAVAFMGWVAIFLTQSWLATSGDIALHRRVGLLAVTWAVLLLGLGPLVTMNAVRSGRVPAFFQGRHFLIADPVTLLGALGLFAIAVALRRRSDWHKRLQIGSFAALMGPSFGRLLPMPLLGPYAFEIACLMPMLFLMAGIGRDLRNSRRVHPAWLLSAGVILASLFAARLIAASPAGAALYAGTVTHRPPH